MAYESPTLEPLGGGNSEPVASLVAAFYVLAVAVWTGAAVWNYVAVVNVAAVAAVAVKTVAVADLER